MKKFYSFVFCGILSFVLLETVLGLRCWRCTSENGEFCGDRLNVSLIDQGGKFRPYVECRLPAQTSRHQNAIGADVVCKKVKSVVNGQIIFSRSCYFPELNIPVDPCTVSNLPGYIDIKYCQTCRHDGCNI